LTQFVNFTKRLIGEVQLQSMLRHFEFPLLHPDPISHKGIGSLKLSISSGSSFVRNEL
jgi:hypothetical protein